MYESCPLKYKFKEIDRLKEPKSPEAVFGTHMHSTLQYIHTPGFASPTLEQALEKFTNTWPGEIFKNETEERSAFTQGVEMVRDYYKKNDISTVKIVELEGRFAIEIPDPEDAETQHILSGIIDRIDKTPDGYEIIDYKTARKMPSQDMVDNNLQLTIYLKAFLKRYPHEQENLKNIKLSLYFLKHGVKLSSYRTREQLDEVDAVFKETIAKIRSEKFEPKVSELCKWCGFQARCPMWADKYQEDTTPEKSEIKNIINEFVTIRQAMTVTRKRLSELQEQLKLYMEKNDIQRLFGDETIIEQKIRKTYEYDTAALEHILEPLNKWHDVIKINVTALKKITNDLPNKTVDQIESHKHIARESKVMVVKKHQP